MFKEVAHLRLEDAAVLLEQKRYAGAVYLAGYAVECLLKWAVTNARQCVYLPADLEIHDLDRLLVEAGLRSTLMRKHEMHAVFSALATSWGPELRYFAKAPLADRAMRLYQQIVEVYDWIAEQEI